MAKRKATAPKLLSLDQFATKKRSDAPVLLYVTESEWQRLTKGLKPQTAQKLPDSGLLFTPAPGGYVASRQCPRGTIPIRMPDGSYICEKPQEEPRGSRIPGGRGTPQAPVATTPCGRNLIIDGRRRFACNGTCPAGFRCQLGLLRLDNGFWFIGCTCARDPAFVVTAPPVPGRGGP